MEFEECLCFRNKSSHVQLFFRYKLVTSCTNYVMPMSLLQQFQPEGGDEDDGGFVATRRINIRKGQLATDG